MIGRKYLLSLAVAVLTTSAAGDVIVLKDGRRLEGEIVADHGTRVTIDTMVSERIRAELSFSRDEIDSMERKPVPQGFFEPPPPPPRASEPAPTKPDEALYLEVPIDGVFGEEVFAAGIEKALRYARRYRVEHVVFRINSAGGDLDEAADIWKVLRKYDRQISYHALVQKCLGDALAIAIWCDDLFMLPGATIGGSNVSMSGEGAEQEAVLRKQLAVNLAIEAERQGHSPDIVRAMFDPAEKIAAWRDDDGVVEWGPEPPADLEPDGVIFAVGDDQLLVLEHDVIVTLGGNSVDGSAADIGPLLGFTEWSEESGYGRQAMAETVAKKEKEKLDDQARYAERVRETIERRDLAERALEHNLKGAAKWDPSKGQYSTYGSRWGWGWGWRRSYRVSTLMTQDSEHEWRMRTDTAMRYLYDAAQAVRVLSELDQVAAEVGLEPKFEPGELRLIADDIQTKYDQLATTRGRRRW
jgi:ATP-dependent protease ClpP protease subunit